MKIDVSPFFFYVNETECHWIMTSLSVHIESADCVFTPSVYNQCLHGVCIEWVY